MSRYWEKKKEKKRKKWAREGRAVKADNPAPRDMSKPKCKRSTEGGRPAVSPKSKPGRTKKKGGLGDQGFRPIVGPMLCVDE
jgi:hypothetical protein